MTVRSRNALYMPNMGRRTMAYPRKGFQIIGGYPAAHGGLNPVAGDAFNLTVALSTTFYGKTALGGAVAPTTWLGDTISTLATDTRYIGSLILHFAGDARPADTVRIHVGDSNAVLTWNGSRYLGTSGAIASALVDAVSTTIQVYLEAIGATP